MSNGYFNEEGMSQPHSQGGKSSSGGLIPITAKILNNASITEADGIEYKGTILSDICAVGYIKEYKEYEARVHVQIWDQTGIINVVFYNKNESESTNGLSSFHYDGQKRLVKVFGTVRVYKKEKNIQGAKILYMTDNDLFCHYLEVINDWLYLFGKLPQLQETNYLQSHDNAKSIARNTYGGNTGMSMSSMKKTNELPSNPYDISHTVITDYSRNHGKTIQRNELHNLLQRKMRSDEIGNTIQYLVNEGFLTEEDDNHYLIN